MPIVEELSIARPACGSADSGAGVDSTSSSPNKYDDIAEKHTSFLFFWLGVDNKGMLAGCARMEEHQVDSANPTST